MFKKIFIIFIFIMGFTIIENVSAECVQRIGNSYYDIKFEVNGGNEIENMQLCSTCADFKNARLPIPTKDGYNFFGWFADSDLTIPVSLSFNWNKAKKKKFLIQIVVLLAKLKLHYMLDG